MTEAPQEIGPTTEFEEVSMHEIPEDVLAALVATGREFAVTRSVTYSVGYMDVPDVDYDEPGIDMATGHQPQLRYRV